MTFWDSVKNGINNGQIAKWTKAIGQTTFAIGATGAMIHGMNNSCYHQRSIFGGGFYSNGMMGMGCCNNSWFNPMNPYVNPLGAGMPNYSMQMNSMNTQYGNMLAAQWGQNLSMQYDMQKLLSGQNNNNQFFNLFNNNTNTQTQLPKTNAKYAGDVDKNQSTDKGEAFDAKSKKMVDKDKAVAGEKFEIIKGGMQTKDAETYKTAVSDLGKSYVAQIDQASGNSDGKVTLDEFIDHSMKDLKSNASEDKKLQAKYQASVAFNKLDQNGDGKLDWKEMSAMMAALDYGSDDKLDGIITSEEYAKNTENLTNTQNTSVDKAVRRTYKQLFGDDK